MSRRIWDVIVHFRFVDGSRGSYTWTGYADGIDDARSRGEAACRACHRPDAVEIHHSTIEADGPGMRRTSMRGGRS